MTEAGYRLLESRKIYQGRIFSVEHKHVRLDSGIEQRVDVIVHPGAVAIAALDEQGRLLLVRQFRAALEQYTLEVPAGRLEVNERPLAAAQRELEEETGYRAEEWRELGKLFPAPGFCNEVIHLFEARGLFLAPAGGPTCDADEEISLHWERPQAISAWEPVDAKTLSSALLLLRRSAT